MPTPKPVELVSAIVKLIIDAPVKRLCAYAARTSTQAEWEYAVDAARAAELGAGG